MRHDSRAVERGWKRLFRLPVFLIANVTLLLLVGVSTLRETVRGWTVDNEIRALEAQAESLEGRKLKLMELTQSLTSPEHVEIEARQRLGWKKDGENVVVLSGFDASSSHVADTVGTVAAHDAASSPLALWWKFFFRDTMFPSK
ncbi:MAG: septum formation initiator family protein [Patescibacteria group bacterium]